MSNTESFVDEVNEELRRDRLYALMRRYGWIAVLAILLLVGGAAWSEWSKARKAAAAQARGDAILAALELPDAAARAEALAGGEGVVARLSEAAARAEAGDAVGALALLQAVGADESLSQTYRDLAHFKAALSAEDAGTSRPLLEQIAAPGRPFALLAREQIAMIELGSGAQDAAIATLTGIYQDAETGPGQKQRISSLLIALGATPDEQ